MKFFVLAAVLPFVLLGSAFADPNDVSWKFEQRLTALENRVSVIEAKLGIVASTTPTVGASAIVAAPAMQTVVVGTRQVCDFDMFGNKTNCRQEAITAQVPVAAATTQTSYTTATYGATIPQSYGTVFASSCPTCNTGAAFYGTSFSSGNLLVGSSGNVMVDSCGNPITVNSVGGANVGGTCAQQRPTSHRPILARIIFGRP